jgi:putative tricarboxylic transport membrane protein
MDLLANLLYGFGVALTAENLLYCLIGTILGTLIGVLPGLGPTATISILLPITFGLPPAASLIMLSGIYYGAQYGGSTTSILVNLPGEASSVVTCLDGYQMARKGRAGPALSIAAFGSLFAGCVGTLCLAVLGPPLARAALSFGPAEYFSLMVLGLVAAVILAHGSLIKALGMIFLGLILGTIGTDINTGVARFSFGFHELGDGIDFIVVAMGVFGLAEIMRNLEEPDRRDVLTQTIGRLMPSREEIRLSVPAVLRGTAIGSLLGALPGAGAVISSFAAYALEKKLSKHPERFGHGAVEGVAAPESANNACAQTAFIPLLTLGIPGGAVTALMLGALMIQGIAPGPQVMTRNPDVFWGLIASMWIGNVFLVILNLPMIGIWIRLLRVPYRFLFPAILVFCCIGVFSLNNATFDIVLMVIFAAFGYGLLKFGCEPAPMLLGFILGPMIEENLRRALLLSRGDPSVFVTRPLSLIMLLTAASLIVMIVFPLLAKRRREIFVEAGD